MPLSDDPEKRARQLANLRRGNPAPQGNTRRLVHGGRTRSEQTLEPLRTEMAVGLRRDYPGLDDRRLAILADRLARMESARRWLDGQDGVVRGKDGEPFPVVALIETWGRQAEKILAELEAERRKGGKYDAFTAAVQGASADE
ncbi:MAG: hypothetical protein ACEQSX_04290 [Baekduiaceae bacterium]